jgi:DeoR/GlpR family transcriptional regulator of sugar metabolism
VKVADHIVKARRTRLTELLGSQRYLPLNEICRKLQISEATARRDLTVLEKNRQIKRTYGGALAEFDLQFPSFHERLNNTWGKKQKIAKTSLHLLRPGMTCFLDAGTTAFALAESLAKSKWDGLQIVTNNLPAAEVLIRNKSLKIFLMGGQYLKNQVSLFGEFARHALSYWKFDIALLGAEGMTYEGIWNSQHDLVLFQRDVLRRSKTNVFCLDRTKLGCSTLHKVVSWDKVDYLLSDIALQEVLAEKIPLRSGQLLPVV